MEVHVLGKQFYLCCVCCVPQVDITVFLEEDSLFVSLYTSEIDTVFAGDFLILLKIGQELSHVKVHTVQCMW